MKSTVNTIYDPAMPTMQQYNLRVTVAKISRAYTDEVDNVQREANQVVLKLDFSSSQTQKFLDAWLPSSRKESHEIVGRIGHPVYGPCRFSIHRRNEVDAEHHLRVMSLGVEEDLLEMVDKKIEITILPEDADGPDGSIADNAKG